MTIKIEVTGNSVPEIADKLLALGAQFRATVVPQCAGPLTGEAEPQDIQPEVEKPKAKKAAKKAEPVEQADEGKDQTGEQASPVELVTEPEAREPVLFAPSVEVSASEPAAPALDFDKDVCPVVVEAVTAHGRDAVVAVLSQFGAERASEVPEGQWAELVEALKAL